MPIADAGQRHFGTTLRLVAKELSAFGVVGAACFVIDLALFQLLYAHVGLGAVTAKMLSTIVSMTVAYLGHRYWSFSHRARTGLRREYLLFATINGITLLVGLAVVAVVRYPLGQDSALVLQVANVGSTVLGTLIRYLSYRQWVFPKTTHGKSDNGPAMTADGLSTPHAATAVSPPLSARDPAG